MVTSLENLNIASPDTPCHGIHYEREDEQETPGSKEDGLHLEGNYHHGATQDSVESFHRWSMLLANRRAYASE